MKQADIVQAITPVKNAFEKLNISYYIGGSVASSAYGVARATLDVDISANLLFNHVKEFVEFLKKDYYIDESMILEAIKNKKSFNIIHLDTMVKVDVFIEKKTLYSQNVLKRIQKDTLDNEEVYFASPEDIIINKLDWFVKGNRVSEKQWNDILGVLKVQKKLDIEYLKEWAEKLSLIDLLDKALKESEI